MVKYKSFSIVILCYFQVILPALCNEDDLLTITRLPEPLMFDGRVDERTWEAVTPVILTMFAPIYGRQPSEKSEVFITYDDEYIYLGARLHYSDSTRIIATSKKRDPGTGGNDYFGVQFDTFNDNENAVGFETSPAGIRSDFAIGHDASSYETSSVWNRSWNTFWDVKTTIEDKIWHVEMRIPFSSLRFQDENGRVIMGMSVWRYIVDSQENDAFPLMTNEFSSIGIWKPSLAQKIVFEGVYRQNPVYITPYILGGIEQSSELNEGQSAYELKNDKKITGGLDVKYGLTNNLTMDLSINTDFAQVEADDQMVNLTRFSLFFPEKRQFFLERSSIFTIQTGYQEQLFYSRRIGLHEGEIVPIIGGARLIGRAGKWDLGFLNMQTTSLDYIDEDTELPGRIESTNHGVYRVRRQVFNPRSYLGGMATSKIDIFGNYNINSAVDGVINVFGSDYLTASYIHTFDSYTPYSNNAVDHAKFHINWRKRSVDGLGYEFQASRAGPYYNPEMGFELTENYSRILGMVRYGWINNDENRKILYHQFSTYHWMNKRNDDFKTDIASSIIQWYFSTKKGYGGYFSISNDYENPADTFELSDEVFFPPATYRYNTFTGNLRGPSDKLIGLRTSWTLGTYFDGYIATAGPAEIMIKPSPSVRLIFDYQYSYIGIPDRNMKFHAHLGRLKTELMFTTKLSLMMLLQYSSYDKFGINNLRFRYNPKEGNDLYLVYNEEYNTYRNREIPPLPFSDVRTFILKYTYTFIWKKRSERRSLHPPVRRPRFDPYVDDIQVF